MALRSVASVGVNAASMGGDTFSLSALVLARVLFRLPTDSTELSWPPLSTSSSMCKLFVKCTKECRKGCVLKFSPANARKGATA